ncbi:SDR family NAD(P)-dependent oxidoreductase [candidate division WOR-3 bacterium]|uniref:SDR family NAD(P)-dependent oxidoreductase n=1 Tax=candidate division WOR-3 bacterium TaxID=2052148 RepID=A0A9D5K7I9_UNCW3|nr:SDR family NAD(P)-dependent oxidoreductase [candidate division WOR-3 bacterium]MBD3363712.1 SDR family NAD(P)-dependent oxidoreductase [candidate division WOR-3 bacterium]
MKKFIRRINCLHSATLQVNSTVGDILRSIRNVHSPIALVTGASTGIGKGFAQKLAADGYNLILVAKTGEGKLLDKVSGELEEKHKVSVTSFTADFSTPQGVDKVTSIICTLPDLHILVNNAGFGEPGIFHRKDIRTLTDILMVNVVAATRIAHAAIPVMLSGINKGCDAGTYKTRGIINLSSLAVFTLYTPNIVYRSTKVFLKGFSDSLAFELRNTGIRVQVLCPGLTRTDMYTKLGYDEGHPIYDKYKFMTPAQVAERSIDYLKRNKVMCIPGFRNKLLAFILSNIPRRLFYAFYDRFMKGMGKVVKWEKGD